MNTLKTSRAVFQDGNDISKDFEKTKDDEDLGNKKLFLYSNSVSGKVCSSSYITVEIGGILVRALVDTGSGVNIIAKELVPRTA